MKQNIAIAFSYFIGLVAILISLWRCEPFELDTVAALATILSLSVAILIGIVAYNYFIQKDEADKFRKEARLLIEAEREERNRQYVTLQEKVSSYGIELVDSPEWIYAITDAENHFLFGIKRQDGCIEWGAGIPSPIRKELEKLDLRIEELSKASKVTD